MDDVRQALGGSRGTDVTGGMASKVEGMLALPKAEKGLQVRVFSGLQAGNITQLLQAEQSAVHRIGTVLGD